MSWEQLCRPGDDEATVRAALEAEFDLAWTGGMSRSVREQLLAQGFDLPTALAAAERARQFLRNEQGDMAPQILDAMAATVAPTH
jgi:hypothetical protein